MKLRISVARLLLTVFGEQGEILGEYPVSTAKAGVGEVSGSYQTPRGRHIVRAKIGGGQPENAVFVRRRPTGEIWTPELGAQYPDRDWILARILWLSGCEPGCTWLDLFATEESLFSVHGLVYEKK